jgi:hypothetical protein
MTIEGYFRGSPQYLGWDPAIASNYRCDVLFQFDENSIRPLGLSLLLTLFLDGFSPVFERLDIGKQFIGDRHFLIHSH